MGAPAGGTVHTVAIDKIGRWNAATETWEQFGSLPSGIKRVVKVFFTPNGDMWIIGRADTIEYDPQWGTYLCKMKK